MLTKNGKKRIFTDVNISGTPGIKQNNTVTFIADDKNPEHHNIYIRFTPTTALYTIQKIYRLDEYLLK